MSPQEKQTYPPPSGHVFPMPPLPKREFGWVRVEDGMPGHGATVILRHGLPGGDYDHGITTIEWPDSTAMWDGVTHWSYIPEPAAPLDRLEEDVAWAAQKEDEAALYARIEALEAKVAELEGDAKSAKSRTAILRMNLDNAMSLIRKLEAKVKELELPFAVPESIPIVTLPGTGSTETVATSDTCRCLGARTGSYTVDGSFMCNKCGKEVVR